MLDSGDGGASARRDTAKTGRVAEEGREWRYVIIEQPISQGIYKGGAGGDLG